MTTKVVTVSPDTSFKEIVELMATRSVSAVPVVSGDGALVGVVSEADLLAKEEYAGGTEAEHWFAGAKRREHQRKASGRTAADLMTAPALTVTAEAPVAQAARKLAQSKVRRLFVVGPDGRLVGVLSRRDMLRLFLRSDEQLRADIATDVLARVLWDDPKAVRVDVTDGVVTLTGRFERRSAAELAARLTATRPGVVGVEDRLTYEWDDVTATKTAGL
ncbi:MAG TPA: CBS domain-containing protein [Actinoplanes sp.]|nr:CBS domain-containing protein [Actinoplanes sp.]